MHLLVLRYPVRLLAHLIFILAFLPLFLHADAPYVYTQAATVTNGAPTTAVLNGMVTPNGVATTAWFEWGLSTNYGNQTASISLGSGSAVKAFASAISGLSGKQRYHYRAVASNSVAVVYGWDQIVPLGKTLLAWGANDYGKASVPGGISNFVAAAGGDYHSLGLTTDGNVMPWGGVWGTNVPTGLSNVVAVAAGEYDGLALKNDSTVATWGLYSDGNSGTLKSMFVPAGLSNVVAVAGCGSHFLALRNDGSVVAWGDYYDWVPGNYSPVFLPPGLGNNAVAVAAGGSESLALLNDGSVMVWGVTYNGGSANNTYQHRTDLGAVVAVAAGNSHSLALRSDGTVTSWDSTVPAGLSNVVAITAGVNYSLALKNNGTVVAWNTAGTIQSTPTGLSNVVAVSAAPYHSFAIAADNVLVPTLSTVNGLYSPGAPYQISFTGTAGSMFGAWASTNLTDWVRLGNAAETSPGNFQFSDFAATNYPHRYYQVRWP